MSLCVVVSASAFASTENRSNTPSASCCASGAAATREQLWGNDYILAWVTTFPAKSTLPWHRHEADRIIICQEDGILIKTNSTDEVETLVFPKDVPTWYNACPPGTLHKDDNPKPFPLHFTILQFKPGVLNPVKTTASDKDKTKASGALLENDYIIVQQASLPAHTSYPFHTTPYDRVVIADKDCDLIQKREDGTQKVLSLKKQIPLWLDADDVTKPYSTANTTDEAITLTVILLKPDALNKASSPSAAQALTLASEDEIQALSKKLKY